MTTLTERLKAATEGSEELDVAIGREWYGYGPDDPLWHMMPFSRSLDAALTLVPEGYAVQDFMIWPGEPSQLTIYETRYQSASRAAGGSGYWHDGNMHRWPAKAATPALALCIAALKARGQ